MQQINEMYRVMEGDIRVCDVAVLLSFLCSIPVNKIPHCSAVVIPNPTVCNVCAFNPAVFGETKLFAVLRHQQYQHSLNADHVLWTVHKILWCICYPENSRGNDIDCLANIASHVGVFPVFKTHIGHVNHGNLKIYHSVGVSSTFFAVMRCSYLIFAVLR